MKTLINKPAERKHKFEDFGLRRLGHHDTYHAMTRVEDDPQMGQYVFDHDTCRWSVNDLDGGTFLGYFMSTEIESDGVTLKMGTIEARLLVTP